MAVRIFLALVFAVGACNLQAVYAQGTSPKRPSQAEVRFADGSLVRMSLLQEQVDVMTKFGKLSIPLTEIRRIEFGLHIPSEVHSQIDQSIRHLGSELYKEREGASRELLLVGHYAGPSLQRAVRSTDQEVSSRASVLLRQLAEKLPPEVLRLKEDDIVHTYDFTVVGRIVSPTLQAASPHFGDMALKLSDLRSMHLRHHASDLECILDAAKFGAEGESWHDTGIHVDNSIRLVMQSEGQIDLWPQGAGQYLATPKGFNATGRGSSYQAGAVVGRIGETGKTFIVGERYEGSPGEEGKLFLQIVASPWNNVSNGLYRIRIQTGHTALSSR